LSSHHFSAWFGPFGARISVTARKTLAARSSPGGGISRTLVVSG
jgi:hypothetical protein